MRILLGLVWAFGGAIVGCLAGAIIAVTISKVTGASNREGAQGYFMVALALVGAVIGIFAGLVLYSRSAPTGEGYINFGSGAFGVVAVMVGIALALFAFKRLREAPTEYGGAMATLEMEFRMRTSDLLEGSASQWLFVEVQTANTRPEGTVLWSKARTEGAFTIIPVAQNPLSRANNRVVVARIEGKQTESFVPPMKRVPDAKADWSEWYRPQMIDPPYGVETREPLSAKLELRYRVRAYGDE